MSHISIPSYFSLDRILYGDGATPGAIDENSLVNYLMAVCISFGIPKFSPPSLDVIFKMLFEHFYCAREGGNLPLAYFQTKLYFIS